jgi:hypothetical protein
MVQRHDRACDMKDFFSSTTALALSNQNAGYEDLQYDISSPDEGQGLPRQLTRHFITQSQP